MAAAEVMDGEVVRRWLMMASDALGQARSAIDVLNVYPVPDADTGTNLHRTIRSAADALADLPPHASPADIWHAAATAALARACRAAALGARQALIMTPQQLDVLAARGVVDAGGAGLCVVLDALSAAISGTQPEAYEVPEPARGRGASAAETGAGANAPASPCDYEVTFLLDAPEQAFATLQDRLDAMGDSLVVSGSREQWHVHVHVADASAVIEADLAVGRPSKITITYLNGPQAPVPAGRPTRAHQIVAVVEGAGLRLLLRRTGATVVDRAAVHSPDRLLTDIARLPGPGALIAPSDLARCWRPGWPVIEVGSVVQVVAALAVHDPFRDEEADAAAIRRAVAGMHCASVSYEARDGTGITPAVGEVLIGRMAGQVVVRGTEQAAVAKAVIDLLLAPGPELLTLLTGQAAARGLGELAAAHVAAVAPAAEVVCYDGGMTSAVLLIGAE